MTSHSGTGRTIGAALAACAIVLAGASPISAATPSGPVGPRSAGAPERPPCVPVARFRSRDFSAPTTIDNPWLPLAPGWRYVLDGHANRGGSAGTHRVSLSVTGLTKVIAGVRSLVVWDVDEQDGELAEAELAFFAQDNRGNVWGVGEYPEEYEAGELVGAPSTWIAGRHGAVPGVAMRSAPRLGTGWYLQGWVPEIDFLDCAKVFKVGRTTCVPAGCFGGVLVIDERSPLDPTSGSQRKYYARGIGNIRIAAVGDPQGETLVLVERRRLSRAELAAAHRAVMAMDRRGRRISSVYAGTAPVERLP